MKLCSRIALAILSLAALSAGLLALGRSLDATARADTRTKHRTTSTTARTIAKRTTTRLAHPKKKRTTPAKTAEQPHRSWIRRSIAAGAPRHKPAAHAAADPGVTIKDFSFGPSSLTIHVGDTVTWTNNGPSQHSAVARNGAFNTGLLAANQSASHTFTQAGTYSYFCSIHPFMTATIVVLASTTTTTTSTTPTTTSTTPTTAANTNTTATTANTGSTLPNTGLDLLGTVITGLALTGAGVALRRRARSHR